MLDLDLVDDPLVSGSANVVGGVAQSTFHGMSFFFFPSVAAISDHRLTSGAHGGARDAAWSMPRILTMSLSASATSMAVRFLALDQSLPLLALFFLGGTLLKSGAGETFHTIVHSGQFLQYRKAKMTDKDDKWMKCQ